MLNRLDSFPALKRDRSLGHLAGKNQSKSTERDIFRYSYNLGKQRSKQLQRAASLAASINAGNTLTDQDDGGLKHRRMLPRSMSVESGPAANYADETKGDLTRVSLIEVSRKRENNALDDTPDTTENTSLAEKPENDLTIDSNESKTGDTGKKSPDTTRPKSDSLSGSVPDLRMISNTEKSKTDCEDFPTFLSPDSSEKSQPRPICKLRRAARRLGVSLSSEELYHKQRRNGLCTEIDDAADNRKLLRVLNKRF